MPDRFIRESALASETLGGITDFAERLFWRLTTAADDFGRFNANPRFILGRCMPLVAGATPRRISDALAELEAAGTVSLYEVDGKSYGHFPQWEKYQRGFRGKPRFPAPPDSPRIAASCGELPQVAANGGESPLYSYSYSYSSSYSGTEESPSDFVQTEAGSDPPAPAPDSLKPQDLADAWNEHCVPAGLSRVAEVSATRRKKALLRLHEHPKIEFWSDVFTRIRGSPFLRGLKNGDSANGHANWRASFDWLIENDTNCVKITEGKYDEQGTGQIGR